MAPGRLGVLERVHRLLEAGEDVRLAVRRDARELAPDVARLTEGLRVDDPVGRLVEGDDAELVPRRQRRRGAQDRLLADVGLADALELPPPPPIPPSNVLQWQASIEPDLSMTTTRAMSGSLLAVADAHVDRERLLDRRLRVAAGAVRARPADHDEAAPEVADERLERLELRVREAQPRDVDEDDAVVVEEAREVRREGLRDRSSRRSGPPP